MAQTGSWVVSRKHSLKIWTLWTLSQSSWCRIWPKSPNRKSNRPNRKFTLVSEMEPCWTKRTKILTLLAKVTYGGNAQIGNLMTQTGSLFVSRKHSLIEGNRPKFGPSEWYIKHTNGEYGQLAQTGSHVAQTGSLVVCQKRSLLQWHGSQFGTSGLYMKHTDAKYGQRS